MKYINVLYQATENNTANNKCESQTNSINSISFQRYEVTLLLIILIIIYIYVSFLKEKKFGCSS
jgi:hypothetical protein